MTQPFTLVSPLDGSIVPLEQVPDPVFSEHMLGDGLAIDPESCELYAPCEGTVLTLNKANHALVLGYNGLEILLHVGLDTVKLNGEGFKAYVKTGDKVTPGQKLISFQMDVLRQKATSPLVLVVVTAPADITLTDKAAGPVKKGQPLFAIPAERLAPNAPAEDISSFESSAPFTVSNKNGLHARPAAVLAKLASLYPYAIQIVHGEQTANAKSIVAIMGLGITKGMTISLRASGPKNQARQILTQLENAFKEGLGETLSLSTVAVEPTVSKTAFTSPVVVRGLCASGGLACGPAFVYKNSHLSFEENSANSQEEFRALELAMTTLSSQLETRISEEKNEISRTILNAHLLLLKDPLLADATRKTILQGKTAAFAFNTAIRRSVDILKKTNNQFLMERIADLKDVRREVLTLLTGQQKNRLAIPPGSILVAEDLLPSEVSTLPDTIAGVLLSNGSPTSHTGILLRNRAIPTLVHAGAVVQTLPPNTPILLEADAQQAILAPSQEQIKTFLARLQQEKELSAQANQAAHTPARTQDGLLVQVEGNVATAEETSRAAHAGADGFGLVRTEFLFHGFALSPSEEEQYKLYQAILYAAGNTPVTFRLLDTGGDKPLPFINITPEENPIVGIRGIRVLKNNESFFRAQLRALLRLKPLSQVRIMIPMVAFAQEITAIKQIVAEEAARLHQTEPVQLGIMVEVPSAALQSEQLAKNVDFFSIGTNDLTQYTLAIDRGHKELSVLADSLHPAVLRMIALTCQGAQAHQKPVAVCGAMAGDLDAVPLLIGLGITQLAVSTGSIARVKALVRRLTLRQCRQVVQEVLQLLDAASVREHVRRVFKL